ncbi:MAG: tetratricopeptide repeat protein, partial [Limisphaerales bacterium]
AVASHNEGDETSFMGPPRDWLDAFARRFIPNRHTHLDAGGPTDDLSKSSEVREILPWLDLATQMNPHDIQTYLVISFWLRTTLHQAPEAEHVLRGGLRENPRNPQLLFELGRIYFDDYHEPDRARSIWQAGLRSWALEKPGVPKSDRLKFDSSTFDDRFVYEQLQVHLARLEGSVGHTDAAIAHLEEAKLASPDSSGLQKMIDQLRTKSHE